MENNPKKILTNFGLYLIILYFKITQNDKFCRLQPKITKKVKARPKIAKRTKRRRVPYRPTTFSQSHNK